ncbi:hypothetical protein QFC21_005927 [Naganishia friedmannii]|uniref:Uncharacterized protein n=1 Tax=Naganishia friedmannii TaxID=89922 RepID=A0ACC2V776_9TREE|nr:hypothetical protein QFC21_005927 [Naganishia friedmannii]
MPSDPSAIPPAYRVYDIEDEEPAARAICPILEEKLSLVDELLPVPVTLQSNLSSDSQSGVKSSIIRIGSVGVIIIFLLTITFYGTAVIGTVDEAARTSPSMKGVIGSLVSSLQGSLRGVEDKMESLSLESADETVEDPQSDIWGDSELSDIQVQPTDGTVYGLTHPDWARYTFLRTLPPSALELEKPERRLILVGDIHGSFRPLKKLMKKLSFDPKHDKIIHVGDVIAKGPEPHSVLDYLRKNKVKGVRGNHDEKVIEWRSWMRWAGKGYQSNLATQSNDDDDEDGWRKFIDELDRQFPPNAENDELSESQRKQLEKELASKLKSFPKDWSWRSEHWKIARALSRENYQYLVDLPLTLHLPSVHSIVVHAGLLARDPSKKATAKDRPYASTATSDAPDAEFGASTRTQDEVALLRTIPQNRDPYTLLNIRSVLKDGETTRKANKGTPWSEIWQDEMSRCTGTGSGLVDDSQGSVHEDEEIDAVEDEEKRHLKGRKKGVKLPKMDCSPVTVIYGHAAGRGLDIKQYSKGLDSGCVYGRQLTALVLGDIKATRKIKGAKSVQVGDKDGVLVYIECESAANAGDPE